MRPLVLRIADLIVLLVATWRIARLATGDRYGPLAMLNAWSRWIETAGFAAVAHSLFWRGYRWSALVPLSGALLRAWHACHMRLPGAIPPGPTDLRLFTMNLLHEYRSADAVVRLIEREQPDVILLQELTPEVAQGLVERLGDIYPYRLLEPIDGFSGFGILSLLPLRDGEILRWPGNRFAQTATVEVGGQMVDLYSCHLMPPLGKRFWLLGPTPVTRLRERQVEMLTERIIARGRPAIVAGDLNLTDSQHAYTLLTPVLVDSWHEAGRGAGVTWPMRLYMFRMPGHFVPLLRIDYCLHTADLVAQCARVAHDPTQSDHCPLIVDLAFAGPAVTVESPQLVLLQESG